MTRVSMPLIKTKGIILRKKDYHENDRLFIIFTEDLGKIQAIGRGARKIKSKMAGHLDLLMIVDLMLARGLNFFQIAGATIAQNFSALKEDLEKVNIGCYFLSLVDQLTKLEQKDEKIFKLLMEALTALDHLSINGRPDIWQIAWRLKLLKLLGYAPAFKENQREERCRETIHQLLDAQWEQMAGWRADESLIRLADQSSQEFLQIALDK